MIERKNLHVGKFLERKNNKVEWKLFDAALCFSGILPRHTDSTAAPSQRFTIERVFAGSMSQAPDALEVSPFSVTTKCQVHETITNRRHEHNALTT